MLISSKGLGSWAPLYASTLGLGFSSGSGSGSCGWFPVPSWFFISFNKTCIKLSYNSTSVSTVLTYITLCITDTMSKIHTSVERSVQGWMSRKIWKGMLYHLSCSTPFSFVLYRDCLYRWGYWFPWCLFHSHHDNHEQANRTCQHEVNGFSTCLEGLVCTYAQNPSKQVEKPFPSCWHILLTFLWLSCYFCDGLAKTIG